MSKSNQTHDITGAASVVGGTLVGGMASRVLADKIPLKNTKLKHGLLTLAGAVGVVFLKNDLAKATCAGIAATQANDLVKELAKPKEGEMKEGIFRTALGNPEPAKPVVVYTPYEDVNENPFEPVFLAEPTATEFAAI